MFQTEVVSSESEISIPEELVDKYWEANKPTEDEEQQNFEQSQPEDILAEVVKPKETDTTTFLEPSPNNPEEVNAGLKISQALTNPKIVSFFNKFYKTNPEKFYSEVVPLAGKQQTELLRAWASQNSPSSVDDMLTGILAELSYTVRIDTAKTRPYILSPEYNEETDLFEDGKLGDEVNAQHYSNLTVPGGTNYTENEISTPGITPSIKGHAQFSTDNGIGWGRWDDKINYSSQDIDSLIDTMKNSGVLKIEC